MRRTVILVGLSLVVAASAAWAQDQPANPAGAVTPSEGAPSMFPAITQGDMYCSGIVSTQSVPTSTQVVSGEESDSKLTFSEGDYIYINRGSSKGVKPGDEFSVVRYVEDTTRMPWFTSQDELLGSMGKIWEDIGKIKVIIAAKDVSTAQVERSCDFMMRGDVVVPFAERPTPAPKPEKDFDRFAPPSGKSKAMVVIGKGFQMQSGDHDIVYVNLGTDKGVKVGDYFRFYRYQGNRHESAFQLPDFATNGYGYGSAPGGYNWSNLPREVVGEGIVLRTSPRAATVLITYTLRGIYEGDHCELE